MAVKIDMQVSKEEHEKTDNSERQEGEEGWKS